VNPGIDATVDHVAERCGQGWSATRTGFAGEEFGKLRRPDLGPSRSSAPPYQARIQSKTRMKVSVILPARGWGRAWGARNRE